MEEASDVIGRMLVNFLKYRRRVFSSILGVLLAVTFVTGTLVAIDSAHRSALDAFLGGLTGDYNIYLSSPVNATVVRDQILAVPGVTNLSLWAVFFSGSMAPAPVQVVNGTPVGGAPYAPQAVLWVEPDHLPVELRGLEAVGSFADLHRSIAISKALATAWGTPLGATVSLWNPVYDATTGSATYAWLNVTVAAIYTCNPSATTFFGCSMGAMFNLTDVGWVGEQLGWAAFRYQVGGEVWVDRDRFVNPYDVAASQRNLARVRMSLGGIASQYDGFLTDNLGPQLVAFQDVTAFRRLLYLLLSVPVLLLGLYLGAVGVDLGHEDRRREMAVLKTRGASRWQVTALLLREAIAGGVLATLGGMAIGLVLSRFLIGLVAPTASTATAGNLLLSPDTLLLIFVLGIALMAGASFRSARRTAKLPIVETLRFYAPGEARIGYRPTFDAIIVLIGGGIFLGIWLGKNGSAGVLTFLLGPALFVLLPLAPILLIVGGTRLLTRSTGRTYEAVSRVWKPLTKELTPIVARNLGRNPRRAANVAVIIALGMAFGLFVFTFTASQQAYDLRVLRAEVGADMNVGAPIVYDPTFPANLSAVPGVAQITPLVYVGTVSLGGGSPSAKVYALDPASFFNTTEPDRWYFLGGTEADAQAVLATPGEVLVTEQLLNDAFLEIGIRLTVSQQVYNMTTGEARSVSVNVTVAGAVRALPGTVVRYQDTYALYGSLVTFGPVLPEPAPPFLYPGYSSPVQTQYLVRLQPGTDWSAVKVAALRLGASNVRAFEEERQRLIQDPFQQAILGFSMVEVAFVVVILTAGLGLVIYAASLERDVEFAAMLARGASGRQVAGLLMGEALSILLVGWVIGTPSGIGSGYLTVVFLGSPGGLTPAVPMLFEVPAATALLGVLPPMAMVLTVLLVAWRTARLSVARVLKLRGG